MIGITAALLALLAVAPAVRAQDNDDGGVLPSIVGGGSLGSQAPDTVSVSGEIQDAGELAGGQSTIRLGGATGIASTDDPAAAMVQAGGETLRAAVGDGEITFQGTVTMALPEQFEVTFEAPIDSVHRTSWLVLHDAGTSLDELLAGDGDVLALAHAGDVDGFDIAAFQALVSQQLGDMPGLAVSWVVGSVDASGAAHLSGVKAPADGGLLEVVAR